MFFAKQIARFGKSQLVSDLDCFSNIDVGGVLIRRALLRRHNLIAAKTRLNRGATLRAKFGISGRDGSTVTTPSLLRHCSDFVLLRVKPVKNPKTYCPSAIALRNVSLRLLNIKWYVFALTITNSSAE